MHEPFPDDELDLQMHALLSAAAAMALAVRDGESFVDAFHSRIPALSPRTMPTHLDERERRSAARALARQLWNMMPLPAHELRPRPLPNPERNSLCPCGSGRKYKQCCLALERKLSGLAPEASLLCYVLNALPQNQLGQLPARRVREADMAGVAALWLEQGEFLRVRKLLEPAYDPAVLGDKQAWMYRMLDDAYQGLGQPRKRAQLQEQTLGAASRLLRAEALQHRATQAADRDEYAQAWQCFHEAMRLNPQDPHLSHLEVTLLLSEGKTELAAERAKYWKQRLRRDWGHDCDDLIAIMEQMLQAPGSLPFAMALGEEPELGALAGLVAALPMPELGYSLRGDETMAELKPATALVKLEKQWAKLFPQEKPMLTQLRLDWHAAAEEELEVWLDWLAANPRAFDSFEVLDDLLLLLTSLPVPQEAIGMPLLKPLMQRALALWRLLLARNPAYGGCFPWGIGGNRPALRLVAQYLVWLEQQPARNRQQDADYAELLRFYLRLNPDDNHGFRENFSAWLLSRGEYAEAHALHQRYAEADPHLSYNEVLTLYRQGERDAAAELAKDLRGQFPELARMLLAKNPRQPALTPGMYTYGGKDQAWYYRQAMLGLWQAAEGALDWLRKQK